MSCWTLSPPSTPDMARLDVPALTFSTGIADAVGYLALDRVFTGNMTGNVARLAAGPGVAAAGGNSVARPAPPRGPWVAGVRGDSRGGFMVTDDARAGLPGAGRGSSTRKTAVLLALRYYGAGAGPAPRRRGARDAAAGAGQHRHQLHRAAGRREARRPARRRRRTPALGDAAVRPRLRRRAAARGGAVAGRAALPEPRRRPRHRAPVRDRHGRTVRQGRRVLPRQLRRVADQAGAELRLPLRGVRRHADVLGRGQPRAAGVRVGGAVAATNRCSSSGCWG